MDTASTPGPTSAEKQKFLNKIQEWRDLGFDVDELEDLLESDFDEFLRRRHKILKGQVELEKDDEQVNRHASITNNEYGEDEPIQTIPDDLPTGVPTKLTASTYTHTNDVPIDIEPDLHSSDDDANEDENILLVGEPIPPEDTIEVEDVDEAVIVVGKKRSTPKSKIHRTQEDAIKMEEDELKPNTKVEDISGDAAGSDAESFDDGEDDVEYDEEEMVAEEYDDSDEDVEFDLVDEDEYKTRKTNRERVHRDRDKDTDEGERKGMKAFGAIIVVILMIFTIFYYFWIGPMMVESEDGEVTADFEITPVQDQFEPGNIITFDASSSKGNGLKYSWDMDDDFVPTEGSLQSKIVRGYFSSSENVIREKTITLKVSAKSNKDSIEQKISIHPSSFTISEEKIGDHGEFEVDGVLDITNPDGIMKMDFDENDITGTFYVKNINIVFKTLLSKPMTLQLKSSIDVRDGFQQLHSVYERNIIQDLDLSGSVSGTADIDGGFSSVIGGQNVPLHADIDGTMQTSDKSYTDFETANTIYSRAKNDVEITISPEYSSYPLGEYSFLSNDLIESYPDLQKDPRNLRLIDLANDELEVGDQSGITTGDVVYTWYAQKVEYIYNRPAMKINISVDDKTKNDNNLKEFFLAFWIAEDISQPVKTQIHSIQEFGDNITTFNYISIMTEFYKGVDLISDQSCNYGTGHGHFFEKNPGYDYIPGYNWSYLSQTGDSKIPARNTTSFDGFTSEQAISKLQSEQAFQDYRNSNPECYVVSGYCTASGEQKGSVPKGTLSWNLTFGSKNSKYGLNAIIPLNGNPTIEKLNIETPINSTDDFLPLLTFSNSEDILLNTSNQDILDLIFDSNSKVDFSKVKYGIETNLEYPNMEITSIMFTEHSKYSYVVSYNDETGERQRMINVALDGETGQMLYYWDHTDDGLSIF